MGKRIVLVLTLAVVAATMMALSGPVFAAPGNTDPNVQKGLAQVRQATAPYHEVSNAIDDGYVPTEDCVELPGVGGMGFHYVNPEFFLNDPSVDPLKPEALLYAPKKNGEVKLVAVEYIVVAADVSDTPSLFGEPFDGPMPGHVEGMPVHYDLHAWIWKSNPSGVFAEFNPKVSC